MRDYAFITTGTVEGDERMAANIELTAARMNENVCPNGCSQMTWDDPHNRHCDTCGFAGWSSRPFDMRSAQA